MLYLYEFISGKDSIIKEWEVMVVFWFLWSFCRDKVIQNGYRGRVGSNIKFVLVR